MPVVLGRVRRCLAAFPPDQLLDLLGGARRADVVALHLRAAFRAHVLELLPRLHAFGRRRHAEADAELGDRAQPGAPAASAEDGRITIDEFMKVELRVAKILEAEAVPKSKKLLKLTVDTGSEVRTIVAGLAEAYSPEQMVGRTVVIAANLKPAKLMGIESNGMVLAASPEGQPPTLISIDESIPAGTRIR